MRDAPSLDIVPLLQKAGATIRAYDPEGMQQAKKLLSDVEWGTEPYGIMEGASGLLILTEWNAFRVLDVERVKSLLIKPLIIDLRNIYTLEEMLKLGVDYHSVGRPILQSSLDETARHR